MGPNHRPQESRHISVVLRCEPARVYAVVADPAQLPRWAAGATGGPAAVRFVDRNEWGVADHTVHLPDGSEVFVPLRVLWHPEGCEVVLTLRPEGREEEQVEQDAAAVRADLERLRALLEDS